MYFTSFVYFSFAFGLNMGTGLVPAKHVLPKHMCLGLVLSQESRSLSFTFFLFIYLILRQDLHNLILNIPFFLFGPRQSLYMQKNEEERGRERERERTIIQARRYSVHTCL